MSKSGRSRLAAAASSSGSNFLGRPPLRTMLSRLKAKPMASCKGVTSKSVPRSSRFIRPTTSDTGVSDGTKTKGCFGSRSSR